MELFEAFKKINSVRNNSLKNNYLETLIKTYSMVDGVLPDIPKVYYILNLFVSPKYEFLSRTTPVISGYSQEKFKKGGIDFFIDKLHPEDAEIIVVDVFKDFQKYYQQNIEYAGTYHVEYNYRFRHANGEYINLQERLHILQSCENGGPQLILGEVSRLEDQCNLPVKASYFYVNEKNERVKIYSKTYCKENRFDQLTRREIEIASILCDGFTNKDIAEKLCISPLTLETHKKHIFKKLKVNSVSDLISLAYKSGFINSLS